MKQVAGRLLHVTKFFGIGCYKNGPLCFEAELLLKTSDAEEGTGKRWLWQLWLPCASAPSRPTPLCLPVLQFVKSGGSVMASNDNSKIRGGRRLLRSVLHHQMRDSYR